MRTLTLFLIVASFFSASCTKQPETNVYYRLMRSCEDSGAMKWGVYLKDCNSLTKNENLCLDYMKAKVKAEAFNCLSEIIIRSGKDL